MLRRSYHLGVRTYHIREAVVLYIGLEAEDNKFLTRIRSGACYQISRLFGLTLHEGWVQVIRTDRRGKAGRARARWEDIGGEGREKVKVQRGRKQPVQLRDIRLWHSCFVEPSNPAWTRTGCCETGAPTTIALLAFRIYRGPSNNMRRYTYTALGAQIISLNASTFRDPPPSAAQQSAAAIIATSFILSQCARPRAKTNLPDTESSSPGRQKATRARPACIPQLHEAEERSHLAPQPERIYTRPYDTSHGVPYPYSITDANDVTKGASFFRGLTASNLSAVFLPLDSGHQRSCCLIDYPPTRELKEPSARKHEKHENKTNEM
ncbi:hypothetical protein ALC62_11751 [Cyphomyrmex costatus]|uniref:Uncharacterized protein n=1 Tax=Cyphomyrmex costatus TaxID=456900 RepID=A0A195C9C0_9HYME|nr:hypothetical protein ALC62_11751 [Cyphomyrmex costatus]